MIKFAAKSQVVGGAVGYNRHPDKCVQYGVAQIERAFLQQALVFSCRGISTLTKHFENADDYIAKMRRLSYRKVPFGEDISFQVALYKNGVLSKKNLHNSGALEFHTCPIFQLQRNHLTSWITELEKH